MSMMTESPRAFLAEIIAAWPHLSENSRMQAFRSLSRDRREELFLDLTAPEQSQLLLMLPEHERRTYLRVLPPDDSADLIQESPAEAKDGLLALLDDRSRTEVLALLAYAEDDAGGLMNPRFARLRPDMTVDEAVAYLRLQGRNMETVYYAYVLNHDQKLLGVVSFRDLFTASERARIAEVMKSDVVAVTENTDQEEVARLFSAHALAAIPVVDSGGVMKGIVTVDDIVDVVQEEATEDIQKIGGMQALEGPYLETGFWEMVRKRAGWLAALFLGEMLTATAMSRYEAEISKAVVLAIFIPLIISSGGNSGSQASTLIIRAIALGEVTLRDWWRVARREVFSGVALGSALAIIGFFRILIWQGVFHTYGEHYLLVALTVAFSLIGVVMFGTLAGSMLPFVLRRAGMDPASASAPFVATMVDVTGLVIYFTVAHFVLGGTLL
ncbi:MAG: Magnesium transporter MgtE [Bryobacteraceae bacterium]|nr:Magnesium transporter MgtE [Bryobacteraceae bacterium]